MKFLSLSVAAIASASFLQAAAPRFEALLPEDTMLLYKVENTTKLRQQLDGHPVAELFTNETVVEFLRPLLDAAEVDGKTFASSFEEETGLTVEEFLNLFPGQFAAGISLQPMLDAVRRGEELDSADPQLFIIAEHSGDTDLLNKMLDKLAEPDEGEKAPTRLQETFLGETLHVFEFDTAEDEESINSLAYATIGETFLLSMDTSSLKEVVARYKGESSSSSFAASAIGSRIDADAAVQLLINGKPVVALFEEAIRSGFASMEAEQRNPLMPTADAVIKALELSAFKGYALSLEVESDVLRIPAYADVDLDRGLGRLLNAYRNDIPRPRLVPEDAVSVQSASFDVPAAWDVVEQTLASASPMAAGMYQGYLGQIEQQVGVNLRNAIIGNLGPAFTVFQVRRPDATSLDLDSAPYASVFVIGIKDRQSLESALEILKGMAGASEAFQKKEFRNHQIYAWGMEGEAQTGYVITDEWLIFSDSLPVLQQALALEQDGGRTVWDNNRFQDATKRLADGGVALDFRAVGPFMQMLLQAFAQGAENSAHIVHAEDPDATVPEFDYSLLKKVAELPFFSVSKSFKTADGIEAISIIFKDESEVR